jgi:hypothetical protein
MSDETERYAIRLSTGQWYQGKDAKGDPQWTRVPSWAHIFDDPAELATFLEWLEESSHEYSLMRAK